MNQDTSVLSIDKESPYYFGINSQNIQQNQEALILLNGETQKIRTIMEMENDRKW